MPDFDLSKVIIKDIKSVYKLNNSPVNVITERKNRERWSVGLKKQGQTIYTCNGKKILSDEFHPVILPMGCSYTWTCTDPGEYYFIEFEADIKCDDILSFEIKDNNFILKNFYAMEKRRTLKKELHEIKNTRDLYDILIFLAETKTKKYTPQSKAELIKPAVNYMAENFFENDITISGLAKMCGISDVYFRKIFGIIYGVSPIKYLHNIRIEKAKELLKSDFSLVSQVAESVGYNSIYNFSKMFKIYTGMTPREFTKIKKDVK